jgi:hypothetical protein
MAGAAQDRGTLRGIARTLLGLALLAERAAGRSLPVRFVVLVLLGRAETIARAFAEREIEHCGWGLDLTFLGESRGMHFGAADAELLALRLRMLAALLGALADAEGETDDRTAGRSIARSAHWAPCSGGAPDPVLLLVFPARRRLRPHDTS